MATSRRPASPLLVGLDMGTTNVKAVIYEPNGRAVAAASVPTITHYPRPTWAYYKPSELWSMAVEVLRQATAQLDDPRRIAGIAVASIGETGVTLDAAGEPTYDAVAWFDRRTIAQADWLRDEIGEDALFAVTGITLQPIFSLCKLMWIKEREPEAFARSVRWLMTADYIAYKLSGAGATDHSLASRTLCFDIHRREWDQGILEAAGIPQGLLAPAVLSGTKVGEVTTEAAAATGLPQGAAVCAGGHDHVCAAFPAGVVGKGQLLDSMGTAEGLLVSIDRPSADPRLGREGYSQGAHVVPGKYYCFGGIYTSGLSIDWARQTIGSEVPFSLLLAEAGDAPVGSHGVVFMPHLRLANPPHSDPRSRAAFVGLSSDVTRGGLLRSVLEGLSYEARASIEPLISYFNLDGFPEVTAVGGSTKNVLFLRIKAAVLRQPLHVLDLEEATALGAAMLAGIGSGVYRDVHHALASIERHPTVVEPDASAAVFYDRYYQNVYLQIYDALRPLNHAIHELTASGSGE